MERQKSGCSQIKVGALFVKGPHNNSKKDPNAGAASFAAQVSAVVGEARYYLCTVKGFLCVRGTEFFYVCANDVWEEAPCNIFPR